MEIKDSGERTRFDTGAVRDMHTGKGWMDLLPWEALVEVSKHCEEGALKYGERNCEKGIPIHMTADIREWRHFLKLRCSPAAHPQMREVALILLDKVHSMIPVCFDDIWSEYHEQG